MLFMQLNAICSAMVASWVGSFLFSIILNLTNAWLVYILVLLLQKKRLIALITSLIFLVHPFLWWGLGDGSSQQRGLFLSFFLLAFILFERSTTPKRINYLNSLALFLLALLFSPGAVILPFLLLLYDYHFIVPQETQGSLNRWKKYYPFFEVLGLFLALKYILFAPSLIPASEPPDFLVSIANIPAIFLYCLALSPDLIPQVSGASEISLLKYLLSAAGVALFISGSIKLYRFSRVLSFVSLWFFLSLVSTLYLTPSPVEPQSYYLPVVAVSWSIGWLLAELWSARYGFMKYLACLFLFFIMAFYLESDIPYNEAVIIPRPESRQFVSPDLADYHFFLAYAYQRVGKYTQAIKENNLALRLNPRAIHPHLNLGVIYAQLGEHDRAIKELQEVLKVFPYHLYALNWLGDVYKKLGKWEKAKEQYLLAIMYDPDDVVARNNLGVIYLREEKPVEAKLHFQHVLTIDPTDPVAKEYLRIMK